MKKILSLTNIIRVFFVLTFALFQYLNLSAEQNNLSGNQKPKPTPWGEPEFVLCDTISFSTPLTIVRNGSYLYAFEDYPEDDFSRETFHNMLAKSRWYFLDHNYIVLYFKPLRNSYFCNSILSLFQTDDWSDNKIKIYNDYEFEIFKLPAENLYILGLVQFSAYLNSQPTIDYEGSEEAIRKCQEIDEIPAYKFRNPRNTYVKVLYPMDPKFRIKEERDKTLDECERRLGIKIDRSE